MKKSILIIFLFISAQYFGQKWHLNNVNRLKKYSHEYWFNFENKDDISSYSSNKFYGNKNSSIEIFNNKGDTVIFANIRISNNQNDSVVIINSDLYGKANFKLEKGKYSIEITAINYDKFIVQLEIKSEEYIELKVKLGLSPELTIYEILSKRKLDEDKIIEIIKCVKKNRDELYDECNSEKYLILVQI